MPESNFHILSLEWEPFFQAAREAEQVALTDPRTSAIKSRFTLEHLIKWMYENDNSLEIPYNTKLNTLMKDAGFIALVDPYILRDLHYIRKTGNIAAHNLKPPRRKESLAAVKNLHLFCQWFVATYGTEQYHLEKFNESLVPEGEEKTASLKAVEPYTGQIDQPIAGFVRKEIEEKGRPAEKEKLEKQLQQTAVIKERNKEKPYEPQKPFTEAETRRLFIDLHLLEAGWDLDRPNVKEYEVQNMPNGTGTGYVDYVLWGDDNKPLAVVEAKRTMHSEKKGKHQATLYADCLEKKFGQRPIIFYTNGFKTWLWDDLEYPPRKVNGFYTRDKLQYLIQSRSKRKDLIADFKINKKIVERYYQEEGIKRVFERFEDKYRGALMVMATGSGKTRTAIAMVDALIKKNWARKILFLADRTALVDQAKNAFESHTPHLTTVNLLEESDEDNARVVFSTYPTMMNRIDGEKVAGKRLYQVDYFDLIIIDEAHRSVYQKYQAIFEYFDAMLLGLTATPKDDVDHNTYTLFGHEEGVPAYYYELDQAVEDGFLVPYSKIEVVTKFHRQGIKYDELSEEEKERYELTFRDETTGDFPEEIDAKELYKWLFNKNTANKILEFVMNHGIKIEGGDKLGKTIIFATNHNHAEFIVEQFDELYPHLKGTFCVVIDNYVDYAKDLLGKFKDPDKLPQIAVSVDMLDTGIDVPEIVNLVFYKRVRSLSKFWQMIGRGTRLSEDLFGPAQDKKEFYIFDFLANFEFFGENPEGLKPTAQRSLTQAIFIHRLDLETAIADFGESGNEEHDRIRSKNLDSLHQMVNTIDEESFVAKPHLQLLHQFMDRSAWDLLSSEDHHRLSNELVNILPSIKDDETAKRFDLLMIKGMISILERPPVDQRVRYKTKRVADELRGKRNIPAVRKQITLIEEIRRETFWDSVSLHDLELVRTSLRDLMKLLDRERQHDVVVDFEDTIESVAQAAQENVGYHRRKNEDYQQKIEAYIKNHKDELVISKIHNNQPITQQELEQLEKLIFDGDERGTKEKFIEAYGSDQPVSLFIRNIIGLERKAAMEAFGQFLDKGNLNPNQINFINKIIDYLTEKGTIDKSKLFKPPFTDINSKGVVGIFPEEDAGRLREILDKINERGWPMSG